MKKLATISFALLLTSACGLSNFQKIEVLDNIKPSDVRVATNLEFKSLQNRGTLKSDDQLYVSSLGTKNGGQFLVKFGFNSFKTKASENGIPAKVGSDVSSVDVFLFKLPTNYDVNTNKNPFGSGGSNVFWSKMGVSKNGTSINLLFTGVPNDETKNYWVGVVARDSGDNIISKSGQTWTGITGTYAGFNLSEGGVMVDNNLMVSTTDPLTVEVDLLDAIGSKLDSTVEINNGSSALPSIEASPYGNIPV